MKRIYRKILPLKLRLHIFKLQKKIVEIIKPDGRYTYDAEGFTTTHFLGFRADHKFNRSFSAAVNSVPSDGSINSRNLEDLEWRAHICTWAANQALKAEGGGDFVECGVWYGVLSKSICEYIDMQKINDRKFFLVDTFGAMPGSHPNPRYKPDIYENVKSRFAEYPSVELIKGVVPDALSKITSSKVAYLAIDMNSSEPELKTLEYFYEKIVKGGIIYFDDYGYNYPELRRVVDKFFSDKPETLLHFPSGNSIVVKI
jgi:O-methyltransferase